MDAPPQAPPQARVQSPVRPPRPGPRPLPLHITPAATTWLSSAAALPLLKRASPNSTAPTPTAPELSVLASSTMWAWLAKVPWHKTVQERADALQRDLAAVDPDAFAAPVGREVRRRLAADPTRPPPHPRPPHPPPPLVPPPPLPPAPTPTPHVPPLTRPPPH